MLLLTHSPMSSDMNIPFLCPFPPTPDASLVFPSYELLLFHC